MEGTCLFSPYISNSVSYRWFTEQLFCSCKQFATLKNDGNSIFKMDLAIYKKIKVYVLF